VQAAINALPSTGGWVLVPSGTYAGPLSVPSNVRITGYVPGIPSATIISAANLVWGTPPADQKTVFTYTSNLTLSRMWNTTIEDVVFDFGGKNDGIVLQNGVFNNTFDIVIQNCGTGTGLSLIGGPSSGESVVGNVFKRLFIFNAGKGLRLAATAPGVASNNYFDYTVLNDIKFQGVEFVNQADSNQFTWLFMALNNTANGISFNTLTPAADVGTNGNVILHLLQDGMNGPSYAGALITINKSFGNMILAWTVGGGLTNGTELTTSNSPSFSIHYAVDFTTPANSDKGFLGSSTLNAFNTGFPLLLNNQGGGTSGFAIQNAGATQWSFQDNLSSNALQFVDAGNQSRLQLLQGGGIVTSGALRQQQAIADQGAFCTNSELALSGGWGNMAAVSAVVGTGQTCEWTITANGTGIRANPTITDTLTNRLPSAGTVCEMRMTGGSGTTMLIDQTMLSATAPVFTFGGTPGSGSTYKVVRRCGP
jgi:hypothetical protein